MRSRGHTGEHTWLESQGTRLPTNKEKPGNKAHHHEQLEHLIEEVPVPVAGADTRSFPENNNPQKKRRKSSAFLIKVDGL
jgi:hypothetical protein